MDKSILSEIIAVERDVQQNIEQEEVLLKEWLEQVRKDAAEAVAEEMRSNGAEMEEATDRARKDAEQRAQVVRDEAEAMAARMDRLDDSVLTDVVMKRLPRIFRV